MTKKEKALLILSDLFANYFYYDRKNDEELSIKDMEELIKK